MDAFSARLIACAVLLAGAPAAAQVGAGPQPLARPETIPAARDQAFSGVIRLEVDATDTAHRVFTVRESLPVQAPGRTVLLYPEWDTASHAPTASAAALAGLVVRGGGRRLDWRRDPAHPFAFHVDTPEGVTRLDIEFQFLSAPSVRQGAVRMTPLIVDAQWPELLLYPAGWFARDIPVQASLRLPQGFAAATSLEVQAQAGDTIRYRPVSLETLADSPVLAGRHTARLELGSFSGAPVRLNLAAERATGLEIPADQLALLRSMLVQAGRVFPSRPFEHYDFLAALTDKLPGPGGIEHLQSSDNVLEPDSFTAAGAHLEGRDLLAHEFVHAWNGRSRQPADLWAPDLNTPVSGSLLWVYEGQTEFWGRVLAARAGLRTRQQTLDALAIDAATAQARAGRSWKSLQDSTNDPLMMSGRPVLWRDWQRREDYYGEGVLLWLDVDMRLRELTAGRRSLDDFARDFFAGGVRGRTTTYTFGDVCAALNRVAPADWAAILRKRLDSHDADGLLDGLARGGYRLVYTDTPTESFAQRSDGDLDLSYSLGLTVSGKGVVRSVSWDGPAFRAGLAPGARLTAVNGRPYDPQAVLTLLNAGVDELHLDFEADDRSQRATISHPGRPRYPRLERIRGAPARLDDLLTPR